jgi:uncharacterized protein (TIGR00297 family)
MSALVGIIAAALIALAARRARSLTAGGALAAFAVGAATFAVGGLAGAVLLLAFFVTSVGLTRVGRARKRALTDIAKGGPRDAVQVFANGGVATLCMLSVMLTGDRTWLIAFAGAYAAATADTWGTEIGTLLRAAPRSLFTAQPIATGLSGGITVGGTLAEIAGALLIAAVALGLGIAGGTRAFAAIAVAGVAGAFADSALGATIQELRWCPRCSRACENDPHSCGTATTYLRGLRAVSNDTVNLLATVVGATVAYAIG